MKVLSASSKFLPFIFRTLFFIVLSTGLAFGQSGGEGNMVTIGVILILGVLVLGAVAVVGNSMVQVLSVKTGVDIGSTSDEEGTGANIHVLKKGTDIKLKGESHQEIEDIFTSRYAIQPFNFNNIFPIPKMVVEEGDEVLAGQALFFDKKHPDVFFVSPVSGEVVEINRGLKRAIDQVVILADKEISYKDLNSPDVETADREEIRTFLKENGGWPLFMQRPYNILPDNDEEPRDIFISGFDTSPLAGDSSVAIDGRFGAIQKGIQVLNKLTDGSVFMSLDGRKDSSFPVELEELSGVEKHYFDGPHPAGNVGVQIHHIKPIKQGDIVWTIGLQELITLGNMFLKNQYDATRIINVCGPSAQRPRYIRTLIGADLSELVKQELEDEKIRVISGNVLCGDKKEGNAFLDFYSTQVTCISEGNDYEMFGWLIPQSFRPTVSPTFPNFALKEMAYDVDTNTHGEKRAFVVSGQYEELLPVDTFPQHLFKAIITRDIDRMEGLGIYELVEEDVALCEFACTSKQPLQKLLREGLDFMLVEA